MLLFAVVSMAQNKITVSGVVTDKTGETVIGASVRVKGQENMGTITDIDGKYQIPGVPANATLIFSYIGMKEQEVALNGRSTVNLMMEEDSQLIEEVVVVGYGSAKKRDLTGSIVTVKAAEIASKPSTNPLASIQGKVAGVQVINTGRAGQDPEIRVRGTNSINGYTPLYVVDGLFTDNINYLNTADIESMEILKDPSSLAIFGVRGANGVIIITTKKGKQGKPVINVSANLAVNKKSAYRDYYSASGYLRYRQDWYKMVNTYGQGENGLYGYYNVMAKDGSGNMSAAYPQGYYDNPANMTTAEQDAWASATGVSGFGPSDGESALSLFARRLTLDVSPLVFNNFLSGKTFDWYDATFRTGINQDYNASISGATDRVNYYLSVGYMDNEGAVQGNEYHAFRSNMKISAKITDWLEIGANVNFQDRSDGDIQVSLGSNYWDANMLRNSPYASMYDEKGGYQQYPMSGLPTNGGYNYYFDRQYYDLEKGYTVLNTIFNAKITLPLGFTYQFNIAPRYQWFYDRYFMSADLPDASASSREWSKNFDWNLNNTITWDRTFADTHHFTVTLVQEAEEHRTWNDKINARNITPSDALGFHYTGGANKEQSSFSTNDTHYTASYLGRLFYSYNDRYMFTGTFRRDGYAGFGAKNPWGNFGSVGLGWTVSNEKFMKGTEKWLDMLKLRLSWGTNGNRDFGDVYKTLANLNLGGTGMVYVNNGTSTVINPLYMDRLAAPNLQWETTKAWNAGVDFSVLGGRLTGSLDYYFKKTTDMIMGQRLPSFSGFSTITTNLGEVQNQGFEIALNSTNIETKDFTWNTSAGFSINKNRINHIYYDYDENGVERDDTSNNWYIGQPIGTIWYYETDGVWQNNPEDIAAAALVGQKPGDPKVVNRYTEDDKILEDGTRVPVYNDNDKTYLGTTTPPIYWNIRNEFTLWKDLTFSFSLYSYMGHKSTNGYWLNQDNGGSQVLNGFNMPTKEYWTPDNPTNDYCRLNAVGPNTGLASGVDKLYNRNFVRLDDITVGYTLPQRWTKKYMIDKVRVTASVKNVCTISGWEYGDPETGGLATRTFNFGLNITL